MLKISKIALLLLLIKQTAALEVHIPEALKNKVAISITDLNDNQEIYAYRAQHQCYLHQI